MILYDLQGTMIASVLTNGIDEILLRHTVVEKIRYYNLKFKSEYGKMIICMDHPRSWRKKIFPEYKANRKKDREESIVDWESAFVIFQKIKDELVEYIPYPAIQIEGAEADDIIATVCKYATDKTVIISRDQDFFQLHNDKVKQYDPVLNDFISSKENLSDMLFDHIVKGDTSDGIPNIFMKEDFFVNKEAGQRQKSITKGILQSLKDDGITEELKERFNKNKLLIDLSQIPKDIEDKITEEVISQYKKNRSKLTTYFMKYKMPNFMEYISDF